MSSESPFELVCCAAMHDSLLYHHLTPLAMDDRVDRIWIVRHRECEFGEIPKAEYVLVPDRPRPLRWLRMLQQCVRLAKRPEVRAIVSFNPFPYGLLATPAARLAKKPIHYAFIGDDLEVRLRSFAGRLALPQLRKASLVTVPGPTFAKHLMGDGFKPSQIRPIRHGVDLSRFVPSSTSSDSQTIVTVGDLIPRKRTDVVIAAFPRILAAYPEARVTIVGDGPERRRLESMVHEHALEKSVTFAGRVNDVRPFLQSSSVFVCTSLREGFPRAMSEALASGLIPVTTRAGTIADYVEDGVHGLHVPTNDEDALAAVLIRLFEDQTLRQRLRSNVLQLRDSFGYESATEVWQEWLASLDGVSKQDQIVSMAS